MYFITKMSDGIEIIVGEMFPVGENDQRPLRVTFPSKRGVRRSTRDNNGYIRYR